MNFIHFVFILLNHARITIQSSLPKLEMQYYIINIIDAIRILYKIYEELITKNIMLSV